MPRRIVLALFAAALASTAAATVVAINGSAGEVCRFRAAAGDPFQRWFASQEIACVPSGSNIAFGPGLWNVYARSQNAISTAPLLVDGASAPPNLSFDPFPAATLAVDIPAGQTAVVYAPRLRIGYPAAGPTMVPAGVDLWVIALSKSIPVAVTVLPPVAEGTTRNVATAATQQGYSDVLAWIDLAEPDRSIVAKANGANLPHIHVAAAGKESEAATLPPVENLDGAIVLLAHVPNGGAELQFGGRGWLPLRRHITAGPEPVTLVRDPLLARLSATLVVNWSTVGDLPALDRSLGGCRERSEPPRYELTISSCTPPKPGEPSDSAACSAVRQEPLVIPPTFGSVRLEEIPPGLYRADLRYGKLPVVHATMSVRALDARPFYLQAGYVEGYGSLTRGGQPLEDDARIEFPGGGVGFAPRGGGDYHAVLMQSFGGMQLFDVDAKIDVVTCRGEWTTVLAEQPMRRNARFDVDIPDNSLTITVVDTFTHITIPGATSKFAVMSKLGVQRGAGVAPEIARRFGQSTVLSRMLEHQGGGGRFFIPAVPPMRDIRLEVKKSGYEPKELPPFSMTKGEKKDIEIELVPVNGTQGRIVSSRPFEKATIFWFAPQYGQTDRADIAPDGTFFYDERSHMRDEIIVVVSSSHPLWMTRAPMIERRKELSIAFPDGAPVREADVMVETGTPTGIPRWATVIGVTIGGLRVPQSLFAQYLGVRGMPLYVIDNGPLHIPPIAETAPIELLRGPTFAMRFLNDAMARRDFGAPTATRPLGHGVDRVIFETKQGRGAARDHSPPLQRWVRRSATFG